MKKLIFKIASWFGFIKSINVETIKKQNVAQEVKTKKSIYSISPILFFKKYLNYHRHHLDHIN